MKETKNQILSNTKTGEIFVLKFGYNDLAEAERLLMEDDVSVIRAKYIEANTTLVNDKEKLLLIIKQIRRGQFEVTYLKSCK